MQPGVGLRTSSQSSPNQVTDDLCYQYNKFSHWVIEVLSCPCMLLGRRHYINSRYDHFSFTHKQIRKWINIYRVNVLFTTPCDHHILSTVTQNLVPHTFNSRSSQKKKEYESLGSNKVWLGRKGIRVRACISNCPFPLQDRWEHEVLIHIGVGNLRTWDGHGVTMKSSLDPRKRDILGENKQTAQQWPEKVWAQNNEIGKLDIN